MARTGGPTMRELLPVAGLTCSAFVFNTSEFMPVGLLTDIAASFGLTEAGAGVMITVYAWAVALISLPLMLAACRLEPRRLTVLVLALFAAGQFASALAPTFALLICGRLLVACAHAVFWSIASPFATRCAAPERASWAMGMIVTGSSIAMIFGLPLGRAIGLAVGWRMTFAIVGAVAAAAAVYLLKVFPRLPVGDAFSLKQLPELLRLRPLVGIYLMTVLFSLGYYVGYSYIEPFMLQVGGLQNDVVTVVLSAFGVAGLAGSLAFQRWFDRHRAFFLVFTCAGVCAALLLMLPAARSIAGLAGVCALWGACGTAINVAFQAEVIRVSPESGSTVAMSIYSGLFNVGIGGGAALGGVVTAWSLPSIGLVGGAVVGLGALYSLRLVRMLARVGRE